MNYTETSRDSAAKIVSITVPYAGGNTQEVNVSFQDYQNFPTDEAVITERCTSAANDVQTNLGAQ